MRHLAAPGFVLLSLFATGCSTNGTGGAADAGTMMPDLLDPAVKSYSVTFDPITVPHGVEDTQCVVKRLGNTEAIRVHQLHNKLVAGSHHLIVYRTAETMERPQPFPCQPFIDTLDPSKGSPLMITQKHDDTLTLPEGVAFSLPADVMVRLEMHYINAGTTDLQVGATSTLYTIPDAAFRDEANFLFIGSPDIDIAANSTATLGPVFFQVPPNLEGSKFFGITGHTHQWGTDVKVATVESKDGAAVSVYDVPGWTWSEPATIYHDPPFQIPPGGGFQFTCAWNNQSMSRVRFGESAMAEMCFFWAYYYPSQGAFVCAHTDRFGGFNICCPGNPLCSQLFP